MNYKYLRHLAKLGSANIHPGGRRATDMLISALDIMDGQHILDIGCGTGETLVRIASKYDVLLTGIDILPEMLRSAEKRIRFTGLSGKIKLQLMDKATPLPFPEGQFDRVFTESALTFHTQDEAEFMLKEIHRVLKVNGIYAANEAVWKEGVYVEKIAEINQNAVRDFGLPPSSPEALDMNDWLKIFDEAGFEVTSNKLVADNSIVISKSNFKTFRSQLYTFISKSKMLFLPSLLSEYFHYKRIMKRHRQDEPVLEGRIFVMRKR